MLTAAWFARIHERLLAGDPTATAELFEAVLGPLKRTLIKRNPGIDDDTLLDDAVTDALFDYVKRPHKFDPAKAGLLGYLAMAAQGDLKNAMAKRSRRWKRQTVLDTVEVGERSGKEQVEDTDILMRLEAEMVKRRIDEHFVDRKDRQIVELVIAKVRSTEAFAEILGVEELPIAEQRREVKRHKDRIKKQLRQLGERIREEER